MAEIGPIISLFKEDVDLAIASNRTTNVSDDTRKVLDPLRDDAFKAVNESFVVYKQLQSSTAGTSYDNSAIAKDVKRLDAQMKKLDKLFKKAIDILRKEAKAPQKQNT